LKKKVDGTDGDHFRAPIYLVCSKADLNWLAARKKMKGSGPWLRL